MDANDGAQRPSVIDADDDAERKWLLFVLWSMPTADLRRLVRREFGITVPTE